MKNIEKSTLLSVRNLTTKLQIKGKDVTVVDDLTFDLQAGKTLAIVGESGCGKSMTALSIMRILPQPPALPPKGEVLYRGQDLLKFSESKMRRLRGKNISMIFQDPMSCLNPVYTVGNQLTEAGELHLNLSSEDLYKHILKSLDDVGIQDSQRIFEEYPHKLSGGMKQRIMIAMALLSEPDILIADEPTTALDVTIQAQVLSLISQLQKKKGTALLLITHDMGVVAEMADDVVVMYSSRAVEKGGVYDIFDHMSHPYTQGLFLSRPHPNIQQKDLQPIQGNVPPITKRPQGCHFHPRCPHAMPCCKTEPTPFIQLKEQHQTLCWLYDKTTSPKQP